MYSEIMDIFEFDSFVRGVFDIEGLKNSDISLNGLQVERKNREIRKVAFAVDACMESFKRAVSIGVDLLFVHHGLFWGRPYRLTGSLYRRISFLMGNDLALYAVHLPLDIHPEYGNNAGIARSLGLESVEAFGEYHGIKIGLKGSLPDYKSLNEIVPLISDDNTKPIGILPFGVEKVKTIGVVSGGASEMVKQAIGEGLDLYITGDASHTVYHEALEGGINVVFAGHYATETWGVRLFKAKVEAELELETVFIDIPTGL